MVAAAMMSVFHAELKHTSCEILTWPVPRRLFLRRATGKPSMPAARPRFISNPEDSLCTPGPAAHRSITRWAQVSRHRMGPRAQSKDRGDRRRPAPRAWPHGDCVRALIFGSRVCVVLHGRRKTAPRPFETSLPHAGLRARKLEQVDAGRVTLEDQ